MAVSSSVQGADTLRQVRALQWGAGCPETSGHPTPAIACPWEASSEASVRGVHSGGDVLQASRLTPPSTELCPRGHPHPARPHARGALGYPQQVYVPLGGQWCGGGDAAAALHVGALGRDWRSSNIVQSPKPFKWCVTRSPHAALVEAEGQTGVAVGSQAQNSCSAGWGISRVGGGPRKYVWTVVRGSTWT